MKSFEQNVQLLTETTMNTLPELAFALEDFTQEDKTNEAVIYLMQLFADAVKELQGIHKLQLEDEVEYGKLELDDEYAKILEDNQITI